MQFSERGLTTHATASSIDRHSTHAHGSVSTATQQPSQRPPDPYATARHPEIPDPKRLEHIPALRHAIRIGDLDETKRLLNKEIKEIDWDHFYATPMGSGPLHIAAGAGQIAMIALLLARGGIEACRWTDKWKATPLHYASRAGQEMTAEYLLNLTLYEDQAD